MPRAFTTHRRFAQTRWWFAGLTRGLCHVVAGFGGYHWPVAGALCSIGVVASGQEPFQNSLAGEAASEARRIQPESQPYTLKSGDFRLLVTPSIEVDWSDNVTLTKNDTLQDVILRPLVQLDASYPVSERNLLRLNVGIGYDKYLQHDEFSALRLESGSELSFDIYVKDFWINLHDRFHYIQDPASQAAVTSSGRYGGLNNTVGLSVAWDLKDLVLTVGYDHDNFVASSSDFAYLDRASELLLAQVGFRLAPRVTAGVEAKGSFTAYDQNVLNQNRGYG